MLIKYVALLLKRKKAKQPFNQLLYLFTVSYKLSERQCDSQNLQFRIPYTPAQPTYIHTYTHTTSFLFLHFQDHKSPTEGSSGYLGIVYIFGQKTSYLCGRAFK